MTIRLVKPPEGYIPPLPSEVTEMLGKDAKKYNVEVLRDVASFFEGGDFNTDLIEQYEESYTTMFNQMAGKFTLPSGNKTTSVQLASQSWAVDSANKTWMFRNMLQKINSAEVPGDNLIEKARFVIDAMFEEGAENLMPGGTSQIPILNDVQDESNVQKKLRALSIGDTPMDKRLWELIKSKSISINTAYQIKKISNILAGEHSFTLKITRNFHEDTNGVERMYRNIKNINEVASVTPNFWAYPANYQRYLLIRNMADVGLKATPTFDKQLVSMIIDCSGSMDGMKKIMAAGVVYNRLLAVSREEVELYIHFFDDKLYGQLYHITNDEEASELLSKMTSGKHFNGGGTDIQGSSFQMIDKMLKIDAVKDMKKRELIVVTDGGSDIDRGSFLLKLSETNFKLHLVHIHEKNKVLEQVARQSGGWAGDIGASTE